MTTTLVNLRDILIVMTGAGHDGVPCAEHDNFYLLPPGELPEESEVGQKLIELGANYDDHDGWTVPV